MSAEASRIGIANLARNLLYAFARLYQKLAACSHTHTPQILRICDACLRLKKNADIGKRAIEIAA